MFSVMLAWVAPHWHLHIAVSHVSFMSKRHEGYQHKQSDRNGTWCPTFSSNELRTQMQITEQIWRYACFERNVDTRYSYQNAAYQSYFGACQKCLPICFNNNTAPYYIRVVLIKQTQNWLRSGDGMCHMSCSIYMSYQNLD